MDRRTLLAIGLMLIVAVLPALLSPPRSVTPPGTPSDSVPSALPETVVVQQPVPIETDAEPEPQPAPESSPALPDTGAPLPPRTVAVESPLYRYEFSTRGGQLVRAALKEYRTFAAGDSGVAQIIPPSSRFLEYALVVGGDTLRLTDFDLQPSDTLLDVRQEGTQLTLRGQRGGLGLELIYAFGPDHYLFDVQGRVTGPVQGGLVLLRLGPRLALVEADSADDFRSYAVVTGQNGAEQLNFRSLDPGEARALEGPFDWVAMKSKYFLVTVLTVEEGQPQLGGAIAVGGERIDGNAVRTDVVASLPAPGGRFAFSTYVGPQEYQRLRRIGHDLTDVNSYGWIFKPIIQPFANAIVVILLWMHENLNMGYGWVLILFGVAVRIVLWPLNQKAMRSSMAMQAIQPEIKAVQDRYKQDPQKMQQEVMKLYKEHGVNPLGGCLPMLIPMPVLFALFFVFRVTIEFRGVPFLWLPDLSRADPYFIIPIVMGLSMFAVSKLGQMGVPPNPQAKMMLYIMPAFLTFIFLKLSSGLNLYYAVSNIASIPQQWLIAKQRLQRMGKRE
jgi:YidC/Oxa1 family membrane protein insertase